MFRGQSSLDISALPRIRKPVWFLRTNRFSARIILCTKVFL